MGTCVSFGADTALANRQVCLVSHPHMQVVAGADIARLQAMSFVAGQRETLLTALKECATQQTIASLQEAHLIITLLGIILPVVAEEELVGHFRSLPGNP